MSETTRSGGCLCGAVRFQLRDEPFKSGLCHCTDCRKVTGSVFMPYAHWRMQDFALKGEVKTYDGRAFCPKCGSRLFALNDTSVEIYLGSLDDAPTEIKPQVEGWCIRREPWLPVIPSVPMFLKDP